MLYQVIYSRTFKTSFAFVGSGVLRHNNILFYIYFVSNSFFS